MGISGLCMTAVVFQLSRVKRIPHVPKPASETSPYPDGSQRPSTVHPFQPVRKRGSQAFEKTHQRFTGWIDKSLKQQFEKLADEQGVSKTSLLNEAIADLLRKYMQK